MPLLQVEYRKLPYSTPPRQVKGFCNSLIEFHRVSLLTFRLMHLNFRYPLATAHDQRLRFWDPGTIHMSNE